MAALALVLQAPRATVEAGRRRRVVFRLEAVFSALPSQHRLARAGNEAQAEANI